MHPQRPRGSQSGREKRLGKRASHWVLTLNQLFQKIQVKAGSWLGTKNALYYYAQLANSFSWVRFSCLCTMAFVSITAGLAHAPEKCTQSGNFLFYIKSPSDFTILSAWKLKTFFQKYKLQFTTGIHACIGQVLRKNIIESFLKVPLRKRRMEKCIYIFFSLYHDYSNSLTLSNESELFWSWISINHIQIHEENEFCRCLFTSFTKREIRHFHR